MLRKKIKQGDYIIVKLKGKKSSIYYVAEVVRLEGVNYIVYYLHKTGVNKFKDRNEPHDDISDDQIVRN